MLSQESPVTQKTPEMVCSNTILPNTGRYTVVHFFSRVELLVATTILLRESCSVPML